MFNAHCFIPFDKFLHICDIVYYLLTHILIMEMFVCKGSTCISVTLTSILFSWYKFLCTFQQSDVQTMFVCCTEVWQLFNKFIGDSPFFQKIHEQVIKTLKNKICLLSIHCIRPNMSQSPPQINSCVYITYVSAWRNMKVGYSEPFWLWCIMT